MSDDKFSSKDVERACDVLATMPYFPAESRAAIMLALSSMCPHKQALDWVTWEAVNHVGKWPGLAEIRGLLCTRFDPADGIDQWCSLPGYSAEDAEVKHFERHKELTSGGSIDGEFQNTFKAMADRKSIGGRSA